MRLPKDNFTLNYCLKELIKDMSLTISDFAILTNVDENELNDIIYKNKKVSDGVMDKLYISLGVTKECLLAIQEHSNFVEIG